MLTYFKRLLKGTDDLNLETLALVASKTDNAVIITDREGKIEWVNDGFERISGYTLEEATGRKPGHLLQGPDTDPDTVDRIRNKIKMAEPVREEILNYTKDGRPYWLQLGINPVFDTEGRLQRFIAIETDITERKAREAESERLAWVARFTNNAVIITDVNGSIEWVNVGFTRISGYTLEEAVGKKPGTLLQGPDTNPEHRAAVRRGIDSGTSFQQRILNYHKDGRPYWLSLQITPIYNNEGSIKNFIAIETDITEEVEKETLLQDTIAQLIQAEEEQNAQAEELRAINEELEAKQNELNQQLAAMRDRDQRLRLLSLVASQTDNAVIITSPTGAIEWVNPGFTRVTGYNPEEVLGRKPGTFLQGPDTDPETVARIRHKLGSRQPFTEEILNYGRSGNPYWLSLSITPVLDEMGDVQKFIAIERDITEEKERAIEREKLLRAVQEKNEELVASEEEQRQMSDQLYLSNQTLAEKNRDITDSITYASRIQRALLPPLDAVKDLGLNPLVWYQPKDIVSGDFYWLDATPERLVLAVADCTGHGVPGAMLSMLGSAFLSQLVQGQGITDPAALLKGLNTLFAEKLAGEGSQVNDTVDLGIVCYIPATRTLQYAGANNNAYIINSEGLTELEGLRRSVGPQVIGGKTAEYHTHTLEWAPGSRLALFSDGLTDQLGGPQHRKLGRSTWLEWLSQTFPLNLAQQNDVLRQRMAEWRGNQPQTDDVLFIALEG